MITYALLSILAAVQAPSRDSLLAESRRLAAMEPAKAVERFRAMLALDSNDVAANWRGAIALGELAQFAAPASEPARNDSLLAEGERYARRAVRLAPTDPGALFAHALLLGYSAVDKGVKQRVKAAVEIRELALRTLAADSTHDGAHHLLGRWNQEIMQLSGFQRFIARNFLGGAAMGQASWEAARKHLERAVQLDSTRIFHRLDLARVCLARKDTAAARAELRRIAELPSRMAADESYRRQARELLEKIGGR